MSAAPPARQPGRRFWTRAQAGRRNRCDVCSRAIPAGVPIVYRRVDDRTSEVLCELDGKRAEDREGVRYPWASTREARGQARLEEVPGPTEGDRRRREAEAEARLVGYGWRTLGSRWYSPGHDFSGGGFTLEGALARCLRTGSPTSECRHAETCANCDPLKKKAEDRVDLTPDLEAAEAEHREACERVGAAAARAAKAQEALGAEVARLQTTQARVARIRRAMADG